MDPAKTILEPLKDTMNTMAQQLVTFAIVVVLAYVIPMIILRLLRLPWKIANIISAVIMLVVSYNAVYLILL
ncbi:hypothetical protein [Psychrobacillus psychrotolerans]|uniref:hypothetical protein n=1 Tax=Psychrobacillus psychrotolerans TaxID=126156 RepID=UPI003B01CC61